VTESGMPGIVTVSSHPRHPRLESGAHSPLNTIAHQRLGIKAAARRAQGALDRLPKAQALPQLMERVDITERPGTLVLDRRSRVLRPTQRTVQTVDHPSSTVKR
jgi:hypothetical protein